MVVTNHGHHGEKPEVLWGEISPCEHIVQIYEDNEVFLDSLEGFVGGGFRSGDGVIVIATPSHRKALDARLRAQGFDTKAFKSSGQYIALDAEEALSHFMKGDWPDEERFHEFISELLLKVRREGRRVRAFGEMVAVLWARGQNGATVRLEHLWHDLCQKQAFCLLCAYPRSGLTQDAQTSIDEICAAHSKVQVI